MNRHIVRQLALLGAGAIAGIIGSLLILQLRFSYWLLGILLIALAVLVLLGGRIDSLVIKRYYLKLRQRRPKIAILNDMGWHPEDSQVSAWTDISPTEWLEEIEKQAKETKVKVRVRLITTNSNLNAYTVVINPYGGVYPEKNLVAFETLDKIFNCVKEGGLFVNVADIPGYWAYNPLLKRRVEAVPPVWDIVTEDNRIGLRELRPFTMVPWMQRLGLRALNIEGSWSRGLSLGLEAESQDAVGFKVGRMDLHRAAKLEENVQPVIGHLSNESGQMIRLPGPSGESVSLTPMFFANYGDGDFLISLVFISAQEERAKHELKEILAACILSRVASRATSRRQCSPSKD